jgi:2-oxo-4-hydroxy-4-carboxy-5-ureidoimidazoline decarboxylase
MEPWRRIDTAGADDARGLLFTCCGSTRWVDAMLARRPFGSAKAMLEAAAGIWMGLGPDDWREAFSHHPKIGERKLDDVRFAGTGHLAAREQSGVAAATDDVREVLESLNRAYEARFGFIFIICATGLSADRMIAALRARLTNDPGTELQIASAEQARITALRLAHLR